MKAFILVGGAEDSRLGKLHRMALLPVSTEKGVTPVINSNLDRLLEVPDVEEIIILLKRQQADKFRTWRDIYYRDEPKIVLKYDEEFAEASELDIDDARKRGPLWSLYLAITNLKISESIIVVPGHNYFEDRFTQLLDRFRRANRPTIGYRNLRFEETVRQKLQVVRLSNGRITQLIDLTREPGLLDTKVAITCYILNNQALNLLKEYIGEPVNELDRTWKFLNWLVTKTHVDGYEFPNRWWDLGTEEEYEYLLWAVNYNRLKIRTVDDLIRAKRADSLPDACFLLGRRFSFNPSTRTITISFSGEDEVCGNERYVGKEMTLGKVTERTREREGANLDIIEAAIKQSGGDEVTVSFGEGTGVPLSGGVFLYDTNLGNLSDFPSLKVLVPLLERDYAAWADPGRLTTPAGRLDDLNLKGLCYSELMEELVFYGLGEANNTRLFTVFPSTLVNSYKVKEKLIMRIVSKNIAIPGIDIERLKDLARNPGPAIDDIVKVLPAQEHDLQGLESMKGEPFWTVKMQIEGRLSPAPVKGVYTIFDKPNCTIEFRIVAFANISETDHQQPRGIQAFGRLMGIADGDGYRRRTFLIHARDLSSYYSKMLQRSTAGTLDEYLFASGMGAVNVAAIGDGANGGRFMGFDLSVPVLSLTTSVSKLAQLTNKLIQQ